MNSSTATRLTISSAARESGLGIETVRYYEREGLLNEPERTPAGYRIYSRNDLSRLNFIRRAREWGFSLREIKELISLLEDRGASAREVRALASGKIERLREQIQALQMLEKALTRLVSECDGAGPKDRCPILSAMALDRVGGARIEASPGRRPLKPKQSPRRTAANASRGGSVR